MKRLFCWMFGCTWFAVPPVTDDGQSITYRRKCVYCGKESVARAIIYKGKWSLWS